MARLLIIDCYLDEIGAAPNFVALVPGHATEIVRAVYAPVPTDLSAYDGIMITGSAASALDDPPWLEQVEATIRRAHETDLPTLGVCFGHQVVARALFGPASLRLSPTTELGWCEIETYGENPLFEGVPERFECFVSHFDEVSPDLAPRLEVSARTERCLIHAFRVPASRTFGIQFHPEMPFADSRDLIDRNLAKHTHIQESAEELLARASSATAIGERIFGNFLKMLDA